MYKRDQFVWIDETGSDNRNFMRKYGYALCGPTPTSSRFLIGSDRILAVAAISCDRLTAVGTTNADFFHDFVCGSLIPTIHSFDGSAPKYIAVLDNCSIHHVQSVVQLLVDTHPSAFSTPYSPDYNPIEECFSYVKYYLRQHDALLQVLNDPKDPLSSCNQHSIASHQICVMVGYHTVVIVNMLSTLDIDNSYTVAIIMFHTCTYSQLGHP